MHSHPCRVGGYSMLMLLFIALVFIWILLLFSVIFHNNTSEGLRGANSYIRNPVLISSLNSAGTLSNDVESLINALTTQNDSFRDSGASRNTINSSKQNEDTYNMPPPHSVFDHSQYHPHKTMESKHTSKIFEVFDCPYEPKPNYPKAYSIMDIINNWGADEHDIPNMHYDSLCHFNFETEFDKAMNYRNADVPFVVYNNPDIDRTVMNWGSVDYVENMLAGKKYRCEASDTNHFMYWHPPGNIFRKENPNWQAPTSVEWLTYSEWIKLAVRGQYSTPNDTTYRYFRASSKAEEWLVKELPVFQKRKSLYMDKPNEQKGIHCRFGMRSVISEAHWDGSTNFAILLGGLRRWILAETKQCKHMYMYPMSHPSGRHSSVNWSQPDLNKYPNFVNVQANEVILQPGDALFVPTNWIHTITSLNINYQCNSRSGVSTKRTQDLTQCIG